MLLARPFEKTNVIGAYCIHDYANEEMETECSDFVLVPVWDEIIPVYKKRKENRNMLELVLPNRRFPTVCIASYFSRSPSLRVPFILYQHGYRRLVIWFMRLRQFLSVPSSSAAMVHDPADDATTRQLSEHDGILIAASCRL